VRVLLSVEFRRFAARELVLVLVVAALSGIGMAGVIAAVKSRPPVAELAARAELRAGRELRACLAGKQVSPDELPPGETLEEFCRANIRPENYYGSQQIALRDLPNWIEGVSFILFVGSLVLGASFVGAEWHAGTMMTLLTWEPRRLRVMAAKVIACVVSVFVLAVGLLVALSLTMTLVAATRGITSGLPDGLFGSVAGSVLRSAAAASLASALGLALAMIGRNTAAAMGVTFGYLAIVEGLIRALRPGWQKWLLGDNLSVFIMGRAEGFAGRSLGGAALVLLLYAGVLLLAAATSFRARDVS